MGFKLTRGNQSDVKASESMLNPLQGLTFADKGYLGKALFERLMEGGLKLITRQRKNMKKQRLSDTQQHLLNQRGMIETIIGHLKYHFHLWHTRHRSMSNAITHLVAALAAYVINPLDLSRNQLIAN